MKSKQVLDVQQMQHLKELGLELKDTMLYWVVYKVGHENNFVTMKENAIEVIDESCGMLPAYTLQDVLDALPESIKAGNTEYTISFYYIHGKWAVDYSSDTGADIQSNECEYIIDAAYSRLLWCIKNGYVETNKNE